MVQLDVPEQLQRRLAAVAEQLQASYDGQLSPALVAEMALREGLAQLEEQAARNQQPSAEGLSGPSRS